MQRKPLASCLSHWKSSINVRKISLLKPAGLSLKSASAHVWMHQAGRNCAPPLIKHVAPLSVDSRGLTWDFSRGGLEEPFKWEAGSSEAGRKHRLPCLQASGSLPSAPWPRAPPCVRLWVARLACCSERRLRPRGAPDAQIVLFCSVLSSCRSAGQSCPYEVPNGPAFSPPVLLGPSSASPPLPSNLLNKTRAIYHAGSQRGCRYVRNHTGELEHRRPGSI